MRFTTATPIEEREKYWRKWLEDNKYLIEKDEDTVEDFDIYGEQIYKLVEAAYNYKQYSYNENEFEDTTKLVRVRLDFSIKEIKALFGIDALYLMGSGVYIPMEGINLTAGTRRNINYDNSVATVGSKGQYLKLESIPQDVIESHKWGLAIPALDGLFVPKKSQVTEWLYGIKALQYFDLQLS